MQDLPIGIQDFKELRTENYLYVDKTEQIHQLITSGKYYFLSRPRRFGKSLLLSTIKYIYQGKRELFKGLWIENNWDWTVTRPVIHISFSNIGYQTLGLQAAIGNEIDKIAQQYDVELSEVTLGLRYRELVTKLGSKQRVVVLIDEYDKPLIDYLSDADRPTALANQKVLKEFYAVQKDNDPYVDLLLITGVSKFSKVSVFSDLNNLYDITLNPSFGTLTGYTQQELIDYFSNYLPPIEKFYRLQRPELLATIREWYNGYSWNAENFVYNPFSILSFMRSQRFSNYWFSTGTPTFLLDIMQKNQYYQLGEMHLDSTAFETYDVDQLEVRALLFQTGYLTIKGYDIYTYEYILDLPNREVRESMYRHLIARYSYGSPLDSQAIVKRVRAAFVNDDLEQVIAIIKALFSNIPAPIFIAHAEAYYHSIIFLVFNYLGIMIDVEVHTATGRADAVVQTTTHIYLFEFKLNRSVKEALQQIYDNNYAAKFADTQKQVVGVGVNFKSTERTITDWQAVVLGAQI